MSQWDLRLKPQRRRRNALRYDVDHGRLAAAHGPRDRVGQLVNGVHKFTVTSERARKKIVTGRQQIAAMRAVFTIIAALELGPLVEKVWQYCNATGVRGRTVTLKIKFADFRIITRSRSRLMPISDRSTLASISDELLTAQFPMRKGVRLLGVSLSSLCADAGEVDTQMTMAL
jgi:DNA polymerase-4